jgi:hypothetical protein
LERKRRVGKFIGKKTKAIQKEMTRNQVEN